MKKCLYCSENIDTEYDDYKKVGKKYVCVFCYDDYYNEIDGDLDYSDSKFYEDDEEGDDF